MKTVVKQVQVVVAVTFIVLCMVVTAEGMLVPKVDNFIIFPDQSGSMFLHYQQSKDVKEAMAKKVLLQMNEIIPELGYTGSAYLFAPFEQLQAPMVYERSALATGLRKIRESGEVFGNLTPMGLGIHKLDSVLDKLNGKTAIIMVSDGMVNIGTDPVLEVKVIRDRYPQVCFHVISFAEDAKGKDILDRISRLGGCVKADGPELLMSRTALGNFVRDVFYEEWPDKPSKKEKMVFRGIRFDFDRYNIKPEWTPVLDEGVNLLKSHPEVKIVVEGHTDGVGTAEYNQRLSERRARAVHQYFVSRGVSQRRMKVEGFGKSQPIATNADEEGRSLNRRVQVRVE